ncbi:hypothetical protein JTB14_011007 [Gonioctena quinquepunctata]|nr:hypothetical protein JTB14_011007 [Gonioctena quinquepunctata]
MSHKFEDDPEFNLRSCHFFVQSFTAFSDHYFKENQTLPSRFVFLNEFIQTERNLLVSRESFIVPAFVPFHVKRSCDSACGFLMDLKRTRPSSQGEVFNEDASEMKECAPIFQKLAVNNRIKGFADCYFSRVTSGLKKRRATVEDLDIILPMAEDVSQNSLQNELIAEESDVERDVLLLDPLLLDFNSTRQTKQRTNLSEHKKMVRITILYTLAFFALALVTFFSIYLL